MQLSFIAFALLLAVGRLNASPVLTSLTDNSVIYNPENEPKQNIYAPKSPIFPARQRPSVQKVVSQGSLGDQSEQFQQDDEEMSTDSDKTPVRRITGPNYRKKGMQNNFPRQQSDLLNVKKPFESSEDSLEEDDFLINNDMQQQDVKQGGMRDTQMYDASDELYGDEGSMYNPMPQQSKGSMTESQNDQSSEGMESLIQYSNDGQQVTIGAVYFDYLTRLMELATLYKEKHNENFWDTLDPTLFGTEEDEVDEEKGSLGYRKQMYTATGDAARDVISAVVETKDQTGSPSSMTSSLQGVQSKALYDKTSQKLTPVGYSQESGMDEEDEEDEEDNVYTHVDDKKFEDEQDLGDDLGGVSLFG